MIEVEPTSLTLKAHPGEVVSAALQVMNLGDDPVRFTADKELTLREDGALPKAVRQAFKTGNQDFAERLITLGTEMASANSCRIDVRGKMEPASLESGTRSEVTLELAMPKDLEPDTTWTGSLAVLGTRLRVRLQSVKIPRERPPRRRKQETRS